VCVCVWGGGGGSGGANLTLRPAAGFTHPELTLLVPIPSGALTQTALTHTGPRPRGPRGSVPANSRDARGSLCPPRELGE